MDLNALTRSIIGAAMEVHRGLGPGLLESAYQQCLACELNLRNLHFDRERALPLSYKGLQLDAGYRLDFVVENAVVVEIKSVEALAPIHSAQVLTYLRIGGWKIGLLINFNVTILKQGLRRLIL